MTYWNLLISYCNRFSIQVQQLLFLLPLTLPQKVGGARGGREGGGGKEKEGKEGRKENSNQKKKEKKLH